MVMQKKMVQVQIFGVFNTESQLITNYPVKEQLERFLEQFSDVEDVSIVGYLVSEPLDVKAVLILKNRDSTTISLIQFIPEYDTNKPAITAIDIEGKFMKRDEAVELFGEYIECVQKTVEDDNHVILGYLVDYKSAFPQVKIDAIVAIKLETVKSTIFRIINIVPPPHEIKDVCKL